MDALEQFTKDFIADLLREMPVNERLKGISPAERLTGISLDERLKGISPDELLAALPPKFREALVRLKEDASL